MLHIQQACKYSPGTAKGLRFRWAHIDSGETHTRCKMVHGTCVIRICGIICSCIPDGKKYEHKMLLMVCSINTEFQQPNVSTDNIPEGGVTRVSPLRPVVYLVVWSGNAFVCLLDDRGLKGYWTCRQSRSAGRFERTCTYSSFVFGGTNCQTITEGHATSTCSARGISRKGRAASGRAGPRGGGTRAEFSWFCS